MDNRGDDSRMRSSIVRPVLVAVVAQVAMTAAMTAVKVRAGRDDADIYFRYATLMREGQVPYRDFRVEYPPLALPLFLVAALASHDVASFKFAFGVEMLIFNAATVWLVARWADRRRVGHDVRLPLVRYTFLYLFLSRLLVLRYDAATTFLGFAAATWWFSGRGRRGGLAAALGTLMKVYPAAIAIVAVPWDLVRPGSSRGRGLAAFLISMTLGSLAWLAVGGPRGVAESLGYQLGRGFEFGSLYSGVQMLAAKAVGAEIAVVRDHAAWASVTPWSPQLLRIVLPVQAATILLVCTVFVRRGMTEGVRFSSAAILAFIIAGKVFSPQYLIWLLPFIAVLERPIARRAFWLFAAGCAATLIAPALTAWYPRTEAVVILAYNIKNALFVALLAVLTFSHTTDGPGDGIDDLRGGLSTR